MIEAIKKELFNYIELTLAGNKVFRNPEKGLSSIEAYLTSLKEDKDDWKAYFSIKMAYLFFKEDEKRLKEAIKLDKDNSKRQTTKKIALFQQQSYHLKNLIEFRTYIETK